MASSRFVSYFLAFIGIVAVLGSTYVSLEYPKEAVSIVFPMFPFLLLVLCILMFLSGFYYFKARVDEDAMKSQEHERRMLQRVVRRVAKGKQPEE